MSPGDQRSILNEGLELALLDQLVCSSLDQAQGIRDSCDDYVVKLSELSDLLDLTVELVQGDDCAALGLLEVEGYLMDG